jgi:sporulation protein YlmC with PRC-barrel domain
MPHYGILREHKLSDVDDLRGAEVYGVNDEKLGKIDDVIFDHSTGEIRYVVLKTGGLLSSKRTMVPAGRVQPYGNHEDKFYAELDKERLAMLPEFHDEMLISEAVWMNFERDNEQRWNESSVLYNKDTGRIITPSPQEAIQPPGGQPLTQKAKDSFGRGFTPHRDDVREPSQHEAERRETEHREVMSPIGYQIEFESAPSGTVPESMQDPRVYKLDRTQDAQSQYEGHETLHASYGRRWNEFQKKLREHKDKVIGGCGLCGSQDKAA